MREIKEFKKVQHVNSYFTLFDNYVYYFVFHVCKNILMPTTHCLSKLLLLKIAFHNEMQEKAKVMQDIMISKNQNIQKWICTSNVYGFLLFPAHQNKLGMTSITQNS